MPQTRPRFDLGELRSRLERKRGPELWKSLDQLAETEEFQQLVDDEFAAAAFAPDDLAGRRQFLKLMGASLALGGLSACTRQPPEKIVPYVRQPEQLVPGKPLYYATALTLGGYALGVLAESHMGRPTKLEGNPIHPESLGATDAITQARILELYDPDRARNVMELGRIRTYQDFLDALESALAPIAKSGGAGLRILTGGYSSPTLAAQFAAIQERYPESRVHVWEPGANDNVLLGAERVFGAPVEPHYRLEGADVIVTFDSDLVVSGPGAVRNARDFASRRVPGDSGHTMNRLYAIESSPTATGSIADHRLALSPRQVAGMVRALAARLEVPGAGAVHSDELTVDARRWVETIASDLVKHHSASAVVGGPSLDPATQVLAQAMNAHLGNVGRTVVYTDRIVHGPADRTASLRDLCSDLEADRVGLLVILGTNPVHTAPSDFAFDSVMQKAPLRMYHGMYPDETAAYCQWHVPAAHELESWSDARALDGTLSVVQPLIDPLFGGKSAHEVLAAIGGEPASTDLKRIRNRWQEDGTLPDLDLSWRKVLHDGLVLESSAPARTVTADQAAVVQAAAEVPGQPSAEIELTFRPDPSLHDGRFANNGWLQELPRPLTKLTWGNAALMAPALAERLGVSNEEVVKIAAGERTLEAPVWIQPGHADGTITLNLGHGRRRAGRVAEGSGVDAYALRSSDAMWSRAVTVTRTGRTVPLACTQDHSSMEGRQLVRSATAEHYQKDPHFVDHATHGPTGLTMFPEWEYEGNAWGLSVDLSRCSGCNACVVACQSENNIPIVGAEQVRNGREMHWIRLDRYYEGELDEPDTHHQPVMCMHCEQAPCEVVCPVSATVHSDEGLNDMVYNRCVGTRYCSNNCPYKVRRFNFFAYNDPDDQVAALRQNPDVTVRSRGVMEKCSYCVQRISHGRIDANREGRPIADGEIQTACQQVCPTQAIVFGDLNDERSQVRKRKDEPRDYGILTELGTRPRTTYLAKLTNPNSELKPESDHHGDGGHGDGGDGGHG